MHQGLQRHPSIEDIAESPPEGDARNIRYSEAHKANLKMAEKKSKIEAKPNLLKKAFYVKIENSYRLHQLCGFLHKCYARNII